MKGSAEMLEIMSNDLVAENVYKMVLCGDLSNVTKPGQFVNIKIDGLYLRRPISVCDKEGDFLTIIYKVVGKGTEEMSRMGKGKKLDVLTGLGNGYSVQESGNAPLLLGGGVGVPPLLWLAKKLVSEGKKVTAAIGFSLVYRCTFSHAFSSVVFTSLFSMSINERHSSSVMVPTALLS